VRAESSQRGLKASVVGFGGLLAVILAIGLAVFVASRSDSRSSCNPPKPHSKPLAVGASAPESFTGGGALDVDGRLWIIQTDPANSPIAGGQHVEGTATLTGPDTLVFRPAGGG